MNLIAHPHCAATAAPLVQTNANEVSAAGAWPASAALGRMVHRLEGIRYQDKYWRTISQRRLGRCRMAW